MPGDTPGDRLLQLRRSRGLSTRDVELRSEGALSHSYVSNLERSVTPWDGVSIGIVRGLARAFDMRIEDFIRAVDGRAELEPTPADASTIPVYEFVGAGTGLEDEGNIVDYVGRPEHWRGKYIAYRINGDSMSPRIPTGSTVIVQATQEAKPGQTIVCYIPEHGMLLKHLDRITPDGTIVLVSFNTHYDPIFATDMHVHGRVHEVRTRYPNGH